MDKTLYKKLVDSIKEEMPKTTNEKVARAQEFNVLPKEIDMIIYQLKYSDKKCGTCKNAWGLYGANSSGQCSYCHYNPKYESNYDKFITSSTQCIKCENALIVDGSTIPNMDSPICINCMEDV